MNPLARWLHPHARPTPTRRACRPQIEVLEQRNLLSATYRPIDEVGNNVANSTWGTAGTDLLRISPAAYADGISAPSLPDNASARAISNLLNDQTDPNAPTQDLSTVNSNDLSAFGYAWGQFIDHDMDLTPAGSGESLPITVAPGDPIGGAGPLPFTRSSFDPSTGTGTSNPRQQINVNTSFLDLSEVYGSTAAVADALRTHVGGQLKTSPGNLPPLNNTTYFTAAQLAVINMANDSQAVPSTDLFVTGDVRGNETLELTALQTLFLRNHNRIAAELQAAHPHWTDEHLYQEARKLNIATEQMITYNAYLPDLLGRGALRQYTGYNPSVNPSIATEFSTVAFRFGHSLLSGDIERQGNDGLGIADATGDASISLAQDFFDPYLLNPNGVVDPLTGHTSSDIGPILKGAADNNAQELDLMVIRDVRNLLFGNGAFGGQDLIARDIQRAHDDGIGTYNQVRVAYGLPAVTSFADITSNVAVQQQLAAAYGSVDNIDPFEGGLAEDHVAGSDMGPLFTAIIADQFARLRDGDRFFYLNEHFNRNELRLLRQADTLGEVITANPNITNLQRDVFIFTASISGTVLTGDPMRHHAGRQHWPPPGMAGVTVQLLDGSGNVLATTTTDNFGQYSFDPQNGLTATGNYTVSVVVPTGYTLLSPNAVTVPISRGSGVHPVDFVLVPDGQAAAEPDPILGGGLPARPR
jgi:hypothetical protein